MEDEEYELSTVEHFMPIDIQRADGTQGYWLTDWKRKQPTPMWTEFSQFIREMLDDYRNNRIYNLPYKAKGIAKPESKPTMPKNPYGRTYFGHPTFNPWNKGPEFVKDGGSV